MPCSDGQRAQTTPLRRAEALVHPAALRELLVLPAGPCASPCSLPAQACGHGAAAAPHPLLPLATPLLAQLPRASSHGHQPHLSRWQHKEGPEVLLQPAPRAGCPGFLSVGSPDLLRPEPSHCTSFRPSSDGPDPALGSPSSLYIPRQARSGHTAPLPPRSARAGPRRATGERCPGWHGRPATRSPSPPAHGAHLGHVMGLAAPCKRDVGPSAEPHAGGWVTAVSPQALGQVQPLQRQPRDKAADAGAVPDAPPAEGGLHPAPQGSPEGHAGAAAGQVSAAPSPRRGAGPCVLAASVPSVTPCPWFVPALLLGGTEHHGSAGHRRHTALPVLFSCNPNSLPTRRADFGAAELVNLTGGDCALPFAAGFSLPRFF